MVSLLCYLTAKYILGCKLFADGFQRGFSALLPPGAIAEAQKPFGNIRGSLTIAPIFIDDLTDDFFGGMFAVQTLHNEGLAS